MRLSRVEGRGLIRHHPIFSHAFPKGGEISLKYFSRLDPRHEEKFNIQHSTPNVERLSLIVRR